MYQLCLGDETFASVIDRIVARACAASSAIEPGACRRLVELLFRSRIRQTVACGAHADCTPHGSVWADGAPAVAGETCEWQDLDPEGVPEMFAAAAADLADVPPSRRHALEARLAAEMRSILRDLLFCNPSCGQSPICRAQPLFPLNRR